MIQNKTQRDKIAEIYKTFFDPESDTAINFELLDNLNFIGILSESDVAFIEDKVGIIAEKIFDCIKQYDESNLPNKKKRIEDLTEKDVIHCPTIEQFEEILELNPNDTCKNDWWDIYKEKTCYRPKALCETGASESIDSYKKCGYIIHKAGDFL